MSQTKWGVALVVTGVLLALVAIFADQLGISANEHVVFGYRQALGMFIGLVVAGTGGVLIARQQK